jgi:hypothetical protein
MSRLLWKGVLQNATSASIRVDDQNELTRNPAWHAFVSGTFGGTSLQISYSPDTQDTTDANSTWYAPTALVFTAGGDTFFWARPRKFRVATTGGNGTTSVNVEIRA